MLASKKFFLFERQSLFPAGRPLIKNNCLILIYWAARIYGNNTQLYTGQCVELNHCRAITWSINTQKTGVSHLAGAGEKDPETR
jgi:hypothetical protein